MKFKIGDKVRILAACMVGHNPDEKISSIEHIYESNTYDARGGLFRCNGHDYMGKNLEHVDEGGEKTMARKRYRLLKDTCNVKKGAIYEEKCDDGTQDFELITPESIKFGSDRENYVFTVVREGVEQQPDWFVEVFQYNLTKEEIAKLRLKESGVSKKKKGRGRPRK